ncbi:MAG: NAD(+)/NADH kinase [Psittacicella sp.]
MQIKNNKLYHENKPVSIIGILGRNGNNVQTSFYKDIYDTLIEAGYGVLVGNSIKLWDGININHISNTDEIAKKADLAIIVGGDGTMLGYARFLAKYNIPVIGINKGHLGFLADISPSKIKEKIFDLIHSDNLLVEERAMIDCAIIRNGKVFHSGLTLNEVVVSSINSHMISYKVLINNKFSFAQKSDGIIVATPTGSTAYSLSAGGPILDPSLNGFILNPLNPHTLSSRPLVIKDSSLIEISLKEIRYNEESNILLSYDGQVEVKCLPTDIIIMKKSKFNLKLLHQQDYNYYSIISSKINWQN